jgi:hypothetical protein
LAGSERKWQVGWLARDIEGGKSTQVRDGPRQVQRESGVFSRPKATTMPYCSVPPSGIVKGGKGSCDPGGKLGGKGVENKCWVVTVEREK